MVPDLATAAEPVFSRLYFSISHYPDSQASINSVAPDGSDFLEIAQFNTNAGIPLAIDSGQRILFYKASSSISRSDLQGMNRTTLVPTPTLPNGVSPGYFDVDPRTELLYFGNRSGRALARMAYDGSSAEEITAPGVDIYSVDLDLAHDLVYFTDAAFGTETRLLRAQLSGASPDTIPLDYPVFDVAVNPVNGMIYFLDTDSSEFPNLVFIKRMQPDGSELDTIVSGTRDLDRGNSPQFRDFTFDPETGDLIVSDSISHEIFRTAPDGTGRTTLYTVDSGFPSQLAVYSDSGVDVPHLSFGAFRQKFNK